MTPSWALVGALSLVQMLVGNLRHQNKHLLNSKRDLESACKSTEVPRKVPRARRTSRLWRPNPWGLCASPRDCMLEGRGWGP